MQGTAHDSLIGSPQGGLASPILANVYLHELDEIVQEIRLRLEQGGKQKQVNPLYRKLSSQKARLVQKGATRTKAFRELVRKIRSTPAVVVDDPTFIRIKYVRYADDVRHLTHCSIPLTERRSSEEMTSGPLGLPG